MFIYHLVIAKLGGAEIWIQCSALIRSFRIFL